MTLTLQEAAVRHGAFSWIELRLFELTGAWAAAPTIPEQARATLFSASAQHAWHAQLWFERLPVLAQVDRHRLVRPVGTAAPQCITDLALAPSAQDHLGSQGRALLAGLAHGLLPALLESYLAFGTHLTEIADGPSLRVLDLVSTDTLAERDRVRALLSALPEPATAGQDHRPIRTAVAHTLGGAVLFPWSEADTTVLFGVREPRS